MTKVYLAGPDVFLSNAKEKGQELKNICAKYNLTGLFPLDNEVNFSGSSPEEIGKKIFRLNIQLIRESDFVIANMQPFRGPSMDVGTVWEIGFAFGLGIPVVGYGISDTDFNKRTDTFRNNNSNLDSKTFFDPEVVENFNLPDNLMIPCSMSSYHKTFEEAVAKVAKQIYEWY